MKPKLAQFFTRYGMLVVLLLLCVFFSVATYTEQSPTGESAATQVAAALHGRIEKQPHILIAVGKQPEDEAFADTLAELLRKDGARVDAIVKGEPKDAREALQNIAKTNQPLNAIACTQTTSAWLLFADLPKDFPTLGSPAVVTPLPYRWPNFLKAENLLNIANQIAVIAIVAIGMTVVIISGGIDLSVGSLLALSAVLCSKLIRDFAGGPDATASGMILCSLAAIVLCGLVGAASGMFITRFRIPAFIVTLSMMLVGSGMAYILSKGQSIYQIPDSFVWLGRGADLFRLPNAVVLMIVLYALAHVLMTRMKWGRYIYAVGGNSEAARLSGVPVRQITLFAYITSALLAGLGGVIMASQLKSGSPTYGNMYELYVIAAVVVGGTSLSGGEGKILGTLIGAFTIAVIQNGMNLTNVESYTQKVVLGLVILGAVLLDKIRHSS